MVILENINIGDKFSTVNKALIKLGYPKSSGNTLTAQIKDAQRYLQWEKTGKLSRGKETNEIIITKIYNTPLDKIENRGGARENAGNKSPFNECFDFLIYYVAQPNTFRDNMFEHKAYTAKDLRCKFGLYSQQMRDVLDNIDTDEYSNKNHAVELNNYLSEFKNEFKTHLKQRFNKNKYVKVEASYFIYKPKQYRDRWLANATDIEIIKDAEQRTLDVIMQNEEYKEQLLNVAQKKIKKNSDYKICTSDLQMVYKIQQEFYKLLSEIYKGMTGHQFCPCFTFEPIKNNEKWQDYNLLEDYEYYQAQCKELFRKWSVIKILTKTKTYNDHDYQPYNKADNTYIKSKHNVIFGKENWEGYSKIKRKFERFLLKQDFKENRWIFDDLKQQEVKHITDEEDIKNPFSDDIF